MSFETFPFSTGLGTVLQKLSSKIWPGIDTLQMLSLTATDAELTDAVTMLFIVLIICIFLLFLSIYIFFTLQYWLVLKDVSHSVLQTKNCRSASEIRNVLTKNEKLRPFSESLIEYRERLYLGQDIYYYINDTYLAPSILCSRFLPLGASLLTGLGVLGTFVGLLLGLGGLNLDGDINHLQEEIRLVAQGASVAFATSVVGVFSSLVINLFEKIVTARVSIRLRNIQTVLSEQFPPFPVMEVFLDIRKTSGESSDLLGGLAEQIGNTMQRSLDAFSQTMIEHLAGSISTAASKISEAIGESLESTLRSTLIPSINRMSEVSQDLASRQAKNSEQALENILSGFMAGVGKEGDRQREAMEGATAEFQQTVRNFSSSMEDMMKALSEQQSALRANQQEQLGKLDAAFKAISEEQSRNIGQMGQGMRTTLEDFSGRMSGEFARQTQSLGQVADGMHGSLASMSEAMEKFFQSLQNHQQKVIQSQDDRTQKLEEQMKDVFDQQSQSLETMGRLIGSHVESTQRLLEQGSSLQQDVNRDKESLSQLGSSIRESSQALARAGDSLKDFSVEIRESIVKSSENVSRTVELYRALDSSHRSTTAELSSVLEGLATLRKDLISITTSMSDSVRVASDGYERLASHYTSLQTVMQNHMKEFSEEASLQVQKLDEHMTRFLQEYSSMVNTQITDRMVSWNDQTRNFCDSIVNAVNTIGEVVDSIEMKAR